jgi:hypothetical protein
MARMSSPPPLPCSRCDSAIEADDLRCPVCCAAVTGRSPEQNQAAQVHVLRCVSCGAAMTYQAGNQATHCAFCGGSHKLEDGVDPIEQTQWFLPFKVDRAAATDAYRQWVSRQGFFRPFDLASAATLESLQATWWPGWVTDAQASITWTADSDAGAKNADWAPHAGEIQTKFDRLVIPATRGLSPGECSSLLPTYILETALPRPTAADQEVAQERIDIPRSQARARVVEAIQRLAEQRIKAGHIPGSRFRNVHASVQLRGLVTKRFAFPAYITVYRYRGRMYRTIISGQDPTQVIGESPRSLMKLTLSIILALLGLVLAGGLLQWFSR